jgi:phage terminase large subunit-like protein
MTAESSFASLVPPRLPDSYSQAERLAMQPREVRDTLLSKYSDTELKALAYDWAFWRRPSQRQPEGDWQTWFVRAGRGFGKTRIGAEGVRAAVENYRRIAIIGATAGDTRDVMIEGESGLLSVFPPDQRPVYEPSKRRITFHSGAVGTAYSADEPERLRGPQHDFGWSDEPASWTRGKAAWDNFSLGLRLDNGFLPRSIITGTPKPTPWLRALSERPSTVTTVGSTFENVGNLATTFIDEVLARYEGTALGRQELHAEWLDDVEGALWVEAQIELNRRTAWDRQRSDKVIVAVDPPGETAECGIVVVGGPKVAGPKSEAFVLDDMSIAGRPEAWGAQVVAAVNKWGAETAVVESNQGGDMCRAVIHAIDADCPVKKITAKASKGARAQPVAALTERGRVHHVGYFPQLESQMVTWVPDESKSPDRLDAMVHGVAAIIPPLGAVARGRVASPLGRQPVGVPRR